MKRTSTDNRQWLVFVYTNKEDPEFYATVLIKAIFLSIMKASRDSTLEKICEALYWTGVTWKEKD